MAAPEAQNQLRLIALLFFIGIGAVVSKLAVLQLVQAEEWEEQIHQGRQVVVRTPGVRGYIADRHGAIMVDNRPSFDVDLYLPDLVNWSETQGLDVPVIEVTRTVEGAKETVNEPDVVHIVKEYIQPSLAELGLDFEVDEDKLRRHYRQQLLVPYTIARDLSFEAMARLQEQTIDIPGVKVTSRPVRRYLYGALMPHILGYVGKPQDIQGEPDVQDYDFYQPDDVGKAGIEARRDADLRGQPGRVVMQTDPKGGFEDEVSHIDPTQGADVKLTINSLIQVVVEEAMRAVGRGACVIVDPRNGDVLAMVSVPSFDPDIFLGNDPEALKALYDDPAKPLTNRAMSPYPAGSTYKIPISIIGLTAGVGNRGFSCSGAVYYGSRGWKCWNAGGHGYLHMSDAIKVSCNCYYYQYGNAIGINNIEKYGRMLGFGQTTGIDLPGDQPGILPGIELWRRLGGEGRWTAGLTANVSIGQGIVNVTPLQMAIATAAVANGGIVYYPNLIYSVVSQEGELLEKSKPRIRTDLRKEGLTPERIELVRKGMWKVVNESGGTARRARLENYEVAGKTGTVQVPHRKDPTDAWFISFAPYDEPRYAMAISVEGGKAGGLVGAPIARQIYEGIFRLEEEESYPPLPILEPAKGHFNYITLVDFSNIDPAEYHRDQAPLPPSAPPDYEEPPPVPQTFGTPLRPVAPVEETSEVSSAIINREPARLPLRRRSTFFNLPLLDGESSDSPDSPPSRLTDPPGEGRAASARDEADSSR